LSSSPGKVTHLEARNSRAGAACTVCLISPDIQIEFTPLVKSSLASAQKPKSDTHAACMRIEWRDGMEFRARNLYKIRYAKREQGAMMDSSQQTDSRGAACIEPVEERKGNYCRWVRAQAAPWLLVWAVGVKHRALTPAHHSLSL
jgi:hypothetical protein